MWVRVNGGPWNNPAAPGNPAAGTGGIDLSAWDPGVAVAAAVTTVYVGSGFTSNFKPANLSAGFGPWDSGGLVPTQLSTLVGTGVSLVVATVTTLAAGTATTVSAGISSSRSTSTALVAQPNVLQLGSGISRSLGTGTLVDGLAGLVGVGSRRSDRHWHAHYGSGAALRHRHRRFSAGVRHRCSGH